MERFYLSLYTRDSEERVDSRWMLPISTSVFSFIFCFILCTPINYNSFLSHTLKDESDVVFRATTGKWRSVVVEISRMSKTGRPVLVGTTSVEQSDALSEQLREAGIPHEVNIMLS